MTIKAKKSSINLREKLAELLNFRQIRDRLDGLGLYLGKDRTGTSENVAVRGGANIDGLQLAEISAALGDTAVDVFVYDTRNDSDGGKWRERTQHTSWYNEELNTATRGGRREFPAVAVIVAEAEKVTIYDGDDQDLSMWMVWEQSGALTWASQYATTRIAVTSLNGKFVWGTDDRGGGIADFIKDEIEIYHGVNEWELRDKKIASRSSSSFISGSGYSVINSDVKDVAMTVLPNARIDSDTGLPIPTIAIAMDGGVSVIKDNGSVQSDTSVYGRGNITTIGLTKNRIYGTCAAGDNLEDAVFFSQPIIFPFPEGVNTRYPFFSSSNAALQFGSIMNEDLEKHIISSNGKAIGGSLALGLLDEQVQDPTKGMFCAISSSYNTGWMPGDIKLATLSDTKIEKVGVDESTELLVDGSGNWIGDFDVTTDVDAWIDQSTGTQSVDSSNVSSGVLTLTRSVSDGEQISKLLNVEAGKKYKLTFDITATTNNKGQIWIGIDLPLENQTLGDGTQTANNILNTGNALGVGSYEYIFTAESTTYLTIRCGGDDTLSYDNISVKQTGELITNGTFDDGTVGWTGLSGGVLSIDNGRLKIEETTNALDAYAVNSSIISTVVGKKYIITWQFIKGTNTGFSTRFGNSGNQSQEYKQNVAGEYTDDGYYSFEFTATGTELNLSFIINQANSYGFVDNVSVRLAEDDRSVNDNGLQIFGEITKSPVAPGADLVAYSGFSANNYLTQPYNSDLDFGTGDFSIMFWQKSTTHSDQEVFFNIGDNNTYLNRYVFYRPSGTDNLSYYGGTSSPGIKLTVSDVLRLGVNNFIVGTRKNGVFTFYVNGQSVGGVSDTLDLTFSGLNRACRIGIDYDGSDPAQSMTLFRISATAPTAEQIAKIYRDEKVLFQDGAQATLYGTSDAVTALAYDDKTELLHVGTSGGRSDFSGLRRINNTTTPVTTSISASNNLIAEQ